MRYMRGRAVLAIIAVALVAGCASASRSAFPSVTTTTPRSVAHAVPTSFDQLARQIITHVPTGFVVQPNTGDMGPSDLAKASKNEPGTRKALSEGGFVRRYARLWVGPGHAQIFVWIDQFQANAGAALLFHQEAFDNHTRPVPSSHAFVVAGIPRGQAIGGTTRGSELATAEAEIQFTTGVFDVEVVCNGPGSESTMEKRVASLAVAQFERLNR